MYLIFNRVCLNLLEFGGIIDCLNISLSVVIITTVALQKLQGQLIQNYFLGPGMYMYVMLTISYTSLLFLTVSASGVVKSTHMLGISSMKMVSVSDKTISTC